MYCFTDFGVWIGLTLAVIAGGRALIGIPPEASVGFTNRWGGAWLAPDEGLVNGGTIFALAMGAFATRRLAVAYGRYLQFRHAGAVALASQVIVALAVLFLILHTPSPLFETYYHWLVGLVR
jgi:hypothetical protein